MLRFEAFVARHGEIVAQAMVENLERYEGIRNSSIVSLEERWQRLMADAETYPAQRLAA